VRAQILCVLCNRIRLRRTSSLDDSAAACYAILRFVTMVSARARSHAGRKSWARTKVEKKKKRKHYPTR
jgi:hypothetical protein